MSGFLLKSKPRQKTPRQDSLPNEQNCEQIIKDFRSQIQKLHREIEELEKQKSKKPSMLLTISESGGGRKKKTKRKKSRAKQRINTKRVYTRS